jgi:HPt (histidine-containing phosphotransfer) domain-containing protein
MTDTNIDQDLSITEDLWDKAEVLKRVRGKEDRLLKLVGVFLDSSDSVTKQLELAIEVADCESAALNAHSLKGSCLNLSAKSTAAIAAKIEVHANQGDMAEVRALWPIFKDSFAALEKILVDYKNS